MLPYLQKVKDRHTPTSIIGNRNLTLWRCAGDSQNF
jgi:hypothetical protein